MRITALFGEKNEEKNAWISSGFPPSPSDCSFLSFSFLFPSLLLFSLSLPNFRWNLKPSLRFPPQSMGNQSILLNRHNLTFPSLSSLSFQKPGGWHQPRPSQELSAEHLSPPCFHPAATLAHHQQSAFLPAWQNTSPKSLIMHPAGRCLLGDPSWVFITPIQRDKAVSVLFPVPSARLRHHYSFHKE